MKRESYTTTINKLQSGNSIGNTDFTVPTDYRNLEGLSSGTYGVVCKAEVPNLEAQKRLGLTANGEDEGQHTETETKMVDDSIPEVVIPDDWTNQDYQINQVQDQNPVSALVQSSNQSAYVAIKRLHHPFDHKTIAKRVFREIFILKHLKSQKSEYNADNVSNFIELFTPNDYLSNISNLKDLYLICDFEGRDLTNIVLDIRNEIRMGMPLTWKLRTISFFGYQLALGLNYIHTSDIVHRDLKPSNIVIKPDPEDGFIVKIIDFGLARNMHNSVGFEIPDEDDIAENLTSYIQARAYRVPELLLGLKNQPANLIYDKGVDIWSFALILLELITGEPLFAHCYKQNGGGASKHIFEMVELLGKIPYYDDLLDLIKNSFRSFQQEQAALTADSRLGFVLKQHLEARKFLDGNLSTCFIELITNVLTYGPSRIGTNRILEHKFFNEWRTEDYLEDCAEMEEKPGVPITMPRLNHLEIDDLKKLIIETCF